MASEWPAVVTVNIDNAWSFRIPTWAMEADPHEMASVYLHRDAARAWQAFRDWLNGTPEQWEEREADAYAEGENDGFDRGVAAVHELREGMSPPDDKAALIRKVLDENRDILEALGDD